MIKKILIALAAVVAVLLVMILMQPDNYKVARSTRINAAPAQVFAQINDFHQWDKWSPWAKIDPNMKATYSGSPQGVGASYYWIGNDDVGEGRMTILESNPNDRIAIKLEFLKPFESLAANTFVLKPEGSGGTSVTWEMAGDQNFMSKAMSLFASMDSMIGADYEKGLRRLKASAESAGK
jgi:uncharacterized protein YndB with AHSA1/START domain